LVVAVGMLYTFTMAHSYTKGGMNPPPNPLPLGGGARHAARSRVGLALAAIACAGGLNGCTANSQVLSDPCGDALGVVAAVGAIGVGIGLGALAVFGCDGESGCWGDDGYGRGGCGSRCEVSEPYVDGRLARCR
jgi:hypothetical protein